MRTGPVVTLDVAKQGAIYHGLAALLSQPSPVRAPRGPPAYGGPEGPSGAARRGAPPPGPRGAPQGIPQSRSTPALHQSPGDGGQHNYQNQEWLHHQLGPRPPVPHHHSAQHLGGPRGPHDMGPRGPHDPQGFYQNLAAPGPPGPPPLHRQRFGSQTSLTGGPQGPGLRDRPASAHFPPGPGSGPQRFQAPRTQVPPPQSSAGGPEKPQRQFSYELENQAPTPVRSQSRVRFQDPQAEDEEKVSTIKRNGNLGQSFEQAMKERQMQEEEERKREAEQRIEEKRRELEEAGRQEERLLAEARRRSSTGPASPPPLPSSPPPRDSPPPVSSSNNATPGTARLDMLLGNGGSRKESPSKRVSFMPPVENSREEGEEEEGDGEEEESEQELEEREASVDREEQDPNAFISEAENLLNPALSKLDFSEGTTGHTPSVIGTQEVYRDPRQRMLHEKQEKKLSTERPPDGAKLSFKEKMKLFAQEVGENTPRDKAKISKAQREIDSVE